MACKKCSGNCVELSGGCQFTPGNVLIAQPDGKACTAPQCFSIRAKNISSSGVNGFGGAVVGDVVPANTGVFVPVAAPTGFTPCYTFTPVCSGIARITMHVAFFHVAPVPATGSASNQIIRITVNGTTIIQRTPRIVAPGEARMTWLIDFAIVGGTAYTVCVDSAFGGGVYGAGINSGIREWRIEELTA